MKLISRAPVRQAILVGDIRAKQKSVRRHLLERGEIPIGLEFVGGLVVVFAVVLLVGLRTEARGLTGKLGGMADRERWDAGMREREVIGAEVVAGFRLRIGRNLQAEAPRDLLCQRPDGGAFRARQHHVFGPAPRIQRIVVERDGRPGRRNQRMRRVILGALQPALLTAIGDSFVLDSWVGAILQQLAERDQRVALRAEAGRGVR